MTITRIDPFRELASFFETLLSQPEKTIDRWQLCSSGRRYETSKT